MNITGLLTILFCYLHVVVAKEYISALYYTSWSYPHNYPAKIPLSQVTDIYFAFADIDPKNKNIQFFDVYTTFGYPRFSLETLTQDTSFVQSLLDNEHTTILETNNDNKDYGNIESLPWVNEYLSFKNETQIPLNDGGLIGQMRDLKKINPRLKISMSIGGQKSGEYFSTVTYSDVDTKIFVSNIVANMKAFGFDGIDIDWEFPISISDSHRFKILIRYLHDKLSLEDSKKTLSVAIPLDLELLQNYDIGFIDKYVDYYNLMGYDISTPMSKISGYMSQLYTDPNFDSVTSIDDTVTYLSIFVNTSKIVLGMPTYGRSYNVDSLYKPFKRCAQINNFQYESSRECIIDYVDLPPKQYTEVTNTNLGAAYAYTKENNGIIVYDTPVVAKMKANYVKKHGLAGGMWWDAKGDPLITNTSRSLIYNFVDELGGVQALRSDITSSSSFIQQAPYSAIEGIFNESDFTSNAEKNYFFQREYSLYCIVLVFIIVI